VLDKHSNDRHCIGEHRKQKGRFFIKSFNSSIGCFLGPAEHNRIRIGSHIHRSTSTDSVESYGMKFILFKAKLICIDAAAHNNAIVC
jgi:hypothetical protein